MIINSSKRVALINYMNKIKYNILNYKNGKCKGNDHNKKQHYSASNNTCLVKQISVSF